MATNHWVKDRVINLLRADPTIGAKALKQKLEEKYCIKISYYVVWDGRQMALNEILGGWEENLNTPVIGRLAVHLGDVRSDWFILFHRVRGHFHFCKSAHVPGFGAVSDCHHVDSVFAAALAAFESGALRAVWDRVAFA